MNGKRSLLVVTLACVPALSCSRTDVSPLAAAARAGDILTIQALLQGGADPNAPSGVHAWTPLHHAIHKSQEQSVLALLSGGADVNASCCSGLTPLMMAAGYGQTETVRVLLARGADARMKTAAQLTALDLAVSGVPDIDAFTLGGCRPDTVRVLLESAPDLRPRAAALGRIVSLLGNCPEVDRMLARGRRTVRATKP
jgi:ankyrin repeat protein